MHILPKKLGVYRVTLFFFCLFFDIFGYSACLMVGDLGSTGSRFHLYQTWVCSGKYPCIREVLEIKSKVCLAKDPRADLKLVCLLKAQYPTVVSICPIASKTSIPLYFLSTAGMRLLPQTMQANYYNRLQQTFSTQNLPFKLVELRTLTGKEEAFYSWLSVNYLRSFQNSEQTVVLDLGGASFEITRVCPERSQSKACMRMMVKGKNYLIDPRSFLKAGLRSAQAGVASSACFPSGYLGDSVFSDVQCAAHIEDYLKQFSFENGSTAQNINYIALSGLYHVMHFFNAKTARTLKQSVHQICGRYHWSDLKKQYPKIPRRYLSQYCFAGIYVSQLLSNKFGLALPEDQIITPVNKILGMSADWPLGVAFMRIVE